MRELVRVCRPFVIIHQFCVSLHYSFYECRGLYVSLPLCIVKCDIYNLRLLSLRDMLFQRAQKKLFPKLERLVFHPPQYYPEVELFLPIHDAIAAYQLNELSIPSFEIDCERVIYKRDSKDLGVQGLETFHNTRYLAEDDGWVTLYSISCEGKLAFIIKFITLLG